MITRKMAPQSRLMVLVLILALFGFQTLVQAEPTRVENSSKPAQGVQKVVLEELWRVGGEDDEDNIFGIVNRALVDDENNIYLLDAQLAQISVYSPDGELIKTLGREGDGPGEFPGP
ncbi:MAG: hypothetical protein GY780_06465, partial [bacterium]|nr:hypothetical protein [bacterium]